MLRHAGVLPLCRNIHGCGHRRCTCGSFSRSFLILFSIPDMDYSVPAYKGTCACVFVAYQTAIFIRDMIDVHVVRWLVQSSTEGQSVKNATIHLARRGPFDSRKPFPTCQIEAFTLARLFMPERPGSQRRVSQRRQNLVAAGALSFTMVVGWLSHHSHSLISFGVVHHG